MSPILLKGLVVHSVRSCLKAKRIAFPVAFGQQKLSWGAQARIHDTFMVALLIKN
jgi:hypothetical protein